MIYNTRVTVVALVEASSKEEAIARLQEKIGMNCKGIVSFMEDDKYMDAFESEPGVKADF